MLVSIPMRKHLKSFVVVNILIILSFGYFYAQQLNFEFLLYIGALLIIGTLILLSDKHFKYSRLVLIGLTGWGLLHLAGGIVPVNGDVLYNLILLPLSETWEILKYDQFVHTFGFGFTTLLFSEVLRPHLQKAHVSKTACLIVLFMAGLGAGAVNEIIEFIATVLVPETNVGGYVNTSLDLVFNSLGALLAVMWLKFNKP